jgi:hypothetical protein
MDDLALAVVRRITNDLAVKIDGKSRVGRAVQRSLNVQAVCIGDDREVLQVIRAAVHVPGIVQRDAVAR